MTFKETMLMIPEQTIIEQHMQHMQQGPVSMSLTDMLYRHSADKRLATHATIRTAHSCLKELVDATVL